jgi:VanZ family protein
MTTPDSAHNPLIARTAAIARLIAWTALGEIILLTFVPSALRPVSAIPHALEHFGVFLLVGGAFALGYPRRQLAIAVAAVPVIAVLELLQLLAPGRHARLSDFVLNALGACTGVVVVSLIGTRR